MRTSVFVDAIRTAARGRPSCLFNGTIFACTGATEFPAGLKQVFSDTAVGWAEQHSPSLALKRNERPRCSRLERIQFNPVHIRLR